MNFILDYSNELRKEIISKELNTEEIEAKLQKISKEYQSSDHVNDYDLEKTMCFKEAFFSIKNIAQVNGDIIEFKYDKESRKGTLKYICCGESFFNGAQVYHCFNALKKAEFCSVLTKEGKTIIKICFNLNN